VRIYLVVAWTVVLLALAWLFSSCGGEPPYECTFRCAGARSVEDHNGRRTCRGVVCDVEWYLSDRPSCDLVTQIWPQCR
jgi:hypothetical protein